MRGRSASYSVVAQRHRVVLMRSDTCSCPVGLLISCASQFHWYYKYKSRNSIRMLGRIMKKIRGCPGGLDD
jgi:hypothetical protein